MATIGGLSARMSIDYQEALQSLQVVEKAAAVTRQRLSELTQSAREVGTVSVDAGGQLKATGVVTDKYGRQVSDLRQETRAFVTDQRFNNRLMTEARTAIMGVAFAAMYFSQNNQNASETQKRLTTSLMAGVMGMQASEAAFFGIGVAGKSMGGVLGGVMQTLGKFAGPLSVVVALGAAFITWIDSANQKMKEWQSTGLENMVKGLTSAAGGKTNLLQGAIADIEAQKTALEELQKTQLVVPAPTFESMTAPHFPGEGAPAVGDVTASEGAAGVADTLAKGNKERDEAIDKIKKAITEQEVMLDFENKMNDTILKHGTLYEKLAVHIKEAQVALASTDFSGEGGDAKRLGIIDQMTSDMNEQKELAKGTMQLAVDQLGRDEMRLQLHQKTNTQIVAEIDHTLGLNAASATDAETQAKVLAIKVKRQQLVQHEKDFVLETAQIQASSIDNNFQRSLAEETARHAKALADIDKETVNGKDKSDRIAAEDKLNIENNYKLNLEKAQSEADATSAVRQRASAAAIAGTRNEYNAAVMTENERHLREMENIGNEYIKEQGTAEAFARLETNLDSETIMHRVSLEKLAREQEQKDMESLLTGANDLATALGDAFSKAGDDATAKFFQVLQIVIQIVKQVNAMNLAAAAGGDTTGGFLSILGSVANMAALFDEGGYTGNLPGHQVAGVVHGGEIVFEKPIVDQYGPYLMSLRKNMQRGYAAGGYVGTPVMTHQVGDLGAVVQALQQAVASLQVHVHLHSVLQGQTFLKKEMPVYTKFQEMKNP